MSQSVNKALIIGHAGADPDIRTTGDGRKIATLSVATSESWKDKATGERQERTQWHRIVIFNEGLASVAERYVRKGSKLYIEGQIETRKWTDQQGVDKYTTEIILRPYRGELTLLDSRRDGPPPADDPDAYGSRQSGAPPATMTSSTTHDNLEDDIPF